MHLHKAYTGLAIAFLSLCAFGSDSARYLFYTCPDYGSQSTFNPLSVLLNGGYDIVQTGMYDARLSRVPYWSSSKNVGENIGHPIRQISCHGWGNFIGSEVFPTRLDIDHAQYVPNYTLHVIGGGTTYRMMCEWNAAHKVPYPKISSVLITTAYNFLNEVIENGPYSGVNVDPIADMWIFNPLGVLLFSSDRVARFFSATLQVSDWSSMPFIDPVHGKIDNVSQNWAIKSPLPFIKRARLFVYLGMSEEAGLSYRVNQEYAVSGGGGLSVRDIVEADSGGVAGRVMTAKYSWNSGLFIDKGNSLLVSLLLSNSRMYKARANLYPLSEFHFGKFRPAFFAAIGHDNDVVFGITANWLPASLSLRTE
jgi:hypothetical protein